MRRYSSFRVRLTFSFLVLLALTIFLASLTQLYGIPRLYKGIIEDVRADTFRVLTLGVDLCKERVNWWLMERTGDIGLLSNNSDLKENFHNLIEAVNNGSTPDKLREKLELKSEYQAIFEILAEVRAAYKIYDSIEIADAKSGIVMVSSNRACQKFCV